MKRFVFAAFIVVVLALLVVATIVAIPCVTHPVHVVNRSGDAVNVRLVVRNTELWSGSLEPDESVDLPIATSVGAAPLELRVAMPDGRPLEGDGIYIYGYPHDIEIYAFVITKDWVYASEVRHPFVTPFESKPWRAVAMVSVLVSKYLSCLFCSEVSGR